MSRPQLVIFDCDGVLVDSEPVANRILGQMLRELGLDLTHARLIGEMVDWQVGNFVHEAIERAKS